MSAACRRRSRRAFAAAGSSCPANFAPRVQTAHKMVTGGMPFLLGELAAELVLSGEADAIRANVRREIEAREAIARQSFAGLDFRLITWRPSCG